MLIHLLEIAISPFSRELTDLPDAQAVKTAKSSLLFA